MESTQEFIARVMREMEEDRHMMEEMKLQFENFRRDFEQQKQRANYVLRQHGLPELDRSRLHG